MAQAAPGTREAGCMHGITSTTSDILLVGGGIMSATLGVLLRRVAPRRSLRLVECAPEPGREASDGWHNAGTGHAGLCELSYTPERAPDGSVPVARALSIFEQFERSREFWSHLVESGIVRRASDFIRGVPHLCFVEGESDVAFLRARHAAMAAHPFFHGMRLAEDGAEVRAWAPLVMEGREPGPVAATRMDGGTEVDFGSLTRCLTAWLAGQESSEVVTGWRVTGLRRVPDGWRVSGRHGASGEHREWQAPFVFVGAGGGTLPLLQTSGLPEVDGLAGFPIGGQWLVCDDPAVCSRHRAKVYGATPPSSPSLGAPHLDLRRVGGTDRLMFGPFGSWTTRFLRNNGGLMDLPRTMRRGNMATLARAAARNRALISYLVGQALQGMDDRMAALRRFYPKACAADWRLVEAGIRVQAIHRSDAGAVYFGTEVLAASDGSLAALLGASPGASVAADVALQVIRRCLPGLMQTRNARDALDRMMPTHAVDLKDPVHRCTFERHHRRTTEILGLAMDAPAC